MKDWTPILDTLQQQGLLRSLRTLESAPGPHVRWQERDLLLLCSNNYLGLADHPELQEAAIRAVRDYGVGSGASRLVSGTLRLHTALEEELAAWKGTEAALVFNSGYAANTGLLPALAGPEDLIFSDALNHASIVDGCRLSRARTLIYPHSDMAALEALLRAELPTRRGAWWIVTDAVFSMDGDCAPLAELVALKQRYDAALILDDAHGSGVWGERGRGTAARQGVAAEVDITMATLGKALGTCGAFVAATRQVIDLLINRARSFIYSTSLPPAALGAARAAVALAQGDEGDRRRAQLAAHAALLAGLLRDGGADLGAGGAHILPVMTWEAARTQRLAAALLERGILLQGIRPPTVPAGACRLRATLMASHAPDDLRWAAGVILDVLREDSGA